MSTRIINSLKTSANGLALIRKHEGLRLKRYKCPAGYWTVGYGHRLRGNELKTLFTITKEQAETLLIFDCSIAELYINGTASVPLNQNQFDALVSFAFNFGVGKLEGSTLWRHVQMGSYRLAAVEFDKWVWHVDVETGKKVKSNGLIKRRASEKALFLTPVEAAK